MSSLWFRTLYGGVTVFDADLVLSFHLLLNTNGMNSLSLMEMSEEDYSSGHRMKIYIYIYVEKSGFIVLTFLSKNLGSRLTLFNIFFFFPLP